MVFYILICGDIYWLYCQQRDPSYNLYYSLFELLIGRYLLCYHSNNLNFTTATISHWYESWHVVVDVLFCVCCLTWCCVFQAEDFVKKKLDEAMKNYGKSEGVTKAWDLGQKDFKCCGSTNYTLWAKYLNGSSVPDSCCTPKNLAAGCGKGQATNPTKIYTDVSTGLKNHLKKSWGD